MITLRSRVLFYTERCFDLWPGRCFSTSWIDPRYLSFSGFLSSRAKIQGVSPSSENPQYITHVQVWNRRKINLWSMLPNGDLWIRIIMRFAIVTGIFLPVLEDHILQDYYNKNVFYSYHQAQKKKRTKFCLHVVVEKPANQVSRRVPHNNSISCKFSSSLPGRLT